METKQPSEFAGFVDIIVANAHQNWPCHQLLAVVQHQDVDKQFVNKPHIDNNGYQTTVSEEQCFVVSTPKFIYGRPTGDVLDQWKLDKEGAEADLRVLKSKIEELEKEMEKLKAELTDKITIIGNKDAANITHNATIETLKGDIKALTDRLNKGDDYMGKALKHFGDRAWKEFDKIVVREEENKDVGR